MIGFFKYYCVLILFSLSSCTRNIDRVYILNYVKNDISTFVEIYDLKSELNNFEIDESNLDKINWQNFNDDRKNVISLKINFNNNLDHYMIYEYSKQYEDCCFVAYCSVPVMKIINDQKIHTFEKSNWDWVVLEDLSEYKVELNYN